MTLERSQALKKPSRHVDGTIATKQSFTKRLRERFFLRFHMSLILIATVLSGLLASKLLLLVPINNMVIRYPLAVLCSYLAFFLLIKIWLWYISITKPFKSSDTVGDLLSNIPDPSVGGTSMGEAPRWGGGLGGRSGGGGASGSLSGPMSNIQEGLTTSSSGSSGSSGGIVDAVGDVASGIDDDSFVLIVLGILLVVIFGSSLYLIINAPHILSDAAFNFLLATSLIRSYKAMNKPDWVGSVFRTAYIPFLIVLLIATGAAWIIHARYPHVIKISEFCPLF
jgi:hypothetical protein